MVNWWKYSAIRFYVLNYSWNFKFWFFSKKKYKEVSYAKKNFFNNRSQIIKKRRFEGYDFKGKTYLDNPGIPDIQRDVWKAWKQKNLIK